MTSFDNDSYLTRQDEYQIRAEQLAESRLHVLKEISSRLDVIKWCAIVSAVALATIAWK